MKYISSSQSSKSMAHHKGHNEIPREWLENICYSKDGMKLLGICIYTDSPDCPGSCPNYNQQEQKSGVGVATSGLRHISLVDKLEQVDEVIVVYPQTKTPVLNQVQKFYKKYGEDWNGH